MTVHGTSAGGGDSYVGSPYDGAQQFPSAYPQAPAQDFATVGGGDPYAGYVDYFVFDQRERWYFPDGKQWIEFKKLNEGGRARYLRGTQSDVRVDQQTREAKIAIDQSKDRKALLLEAICDWHIVRRDPRQGGRMVEVPFNSNNSQGGELAKWIDSQDPALLGSLEKAIRKVNPWLMNEMSVEQIDKEINDLTELREVALRREESEKNSESR